MPANPSTPAPPPSPGHGLASILRRDRRRIVLAYLLSSLTWILCSDALIRLLTTDIATASYWQTWKGAFYVTASAALLYVLLRPLARRVVATHEQLESSETRHRQMFEGNPGPILVYDIHSLQILDANPAACSFFGWPSAEFKQLDMHALWPLDAPTRLEDTVAALREHPEKLCVINTHLRLRDGSSRRMEMRSNSIDYNGRPARLLIAIDRSVEDQAQQRRDQALARLEEAHELARIGAWELDPATGLGRYSNQVYHLLGRRVPAARRWHRFEELLVAADQSTGSHAERLISDMCSGDSVHIDVLLPLLAMDGRSLMVHLRAESGLDDTGRMRILGTLQDVSEREHSRRLLREREEQFRELVRVLPDGVIILSDDYVLYANACSAAQFGYDNQRLLGEPLSALVAPADLALVRNYLHAAMNGAAGVVAPGITAGMRRSSGEHFLAGLSMGEVRYGGRDCKLLIVRDLSEPERIRDALETSNRELQAMARRLFSLQEDERRAISRDLHDDIGQAITAMKLGAHAALDETNVERRHDDLQQIVSLADTTITKLRNLSMLLRPPQLDALGLEAALRWQAGLLFRSSALELLPDIDTLPQRPSGEIEQACFRIAQESLTNVLRHAHASQVHLQLKDEDGEHLRLQVTDDGDGFDPEGPRGLGLIVMRERAQTAGGTLHIDSAPGAGTRIDLRLPYRAATVTMNEPVGHPI